MKQRSDAAQFSSVSLFRNIQFFLCPQSIDSSIDGPVLTYCIEYGGGTIIPSLFSCSGSTPTFIICEPSCYTKYRALLLTSFFHIVSPAWLYRSVFTHRIQPADRFSHDPEKFFAGLIIAVPPHSVPKEPLKVLSSLIYQYGGQVASALSGECTHLLSLDANSDEVQHAVREKETWDTIYSCLGSLNTGVSHAGVSHTAANHVLDTIRNSPSVKFPQNLPHEVVEYISLHCGIGATHIVHIDWVEQCVKNERRVEEKPYSMVLSPSEKTAIKQHPSGLQWTRNEALEKLQHAQKVIRDNPMRVGVPTNYEYRMLWRDLAKIKSKGLSHVLEGYKIAVSDLINPRIRLKVENRIVQLGGEVVSNREYNHVRDRVAHCTHVVSEVDSGEYFQQALAQKKELRSVHWLCLCISSKERIDVVDHVQERSLPFASLLSVPRPFWTVSPPLHGCVITTTGFTVDSHPSREEIQLAIQRLGACALPVLSRTHTTHLVLFNAAACSGEKYQKAKQWALSHVVFAQWLLDCLMHSKRVREDRYTVHVESTVVERITQKNKDSTSTSTLLNAVLPQVSEERRATVENSSTDQPNVQADTEETQLTRLTVEKKNTLSTLCSMMEGSNNNNNSSVGDCEWRKSVELETSNIVTKTSKPTLDLKDAMDSLATPRPHVEKKNSMRREDESECLNSSNSSHGINPRGTMLKLSSPIQVSMPFTSEKKPSRDREEVKNCGGNASLSSSSLGTLDPTEKETEGTVEEGKDQTPFCVQKKLRFDLCQQNEEEEEQEEEILEGDQCTETEQEEEKCTEETDSMEVASRSGGGGGGGAGHSCGGVSEGVAFVYPSESVDQDLDVSNGVDVCSLNSREEIVGRSKVLFVEEDSLEISARDFASPVPVLMRKKRCVKRSSGESNGAQSCEDEETQVLEETGNYDDKKKEQQQQQQQPRIEDEEETLDTRDDCSVEFGNNVVESTEKCSGGMKEPDVSSEEFVVLGGKQELVLCRNEVEEKEKEKDGVVKFEDVSSLGGEDNKVIESFDQNHDVVNEVEEEEKVENIEQNQDSNVENMEKNEDLSSEIEEKVENITGKIVSDRDCKSVVESVCSTVENSKKEEDESSGRETVEECENSDVAVLHGTKVVQAESMVQNTSSTAHCVSNELVEDETLVGEKRFLLTGTLEEQAMNASMVVRLGGTVCDSGRQYDSECTHIICLELKRTEKFIAGCAAGKWILTPQYLTDSCLNGAFLPEHKYEWGSNHLQSKRNARIIASEYVDPRIWIGAPSYWRKEYNEGPHRAPFMRWKVAFYGKMVPPPDMCDRMVSAGGAQVLGHATNLKQLQLHLCELHRAQTTGTEVALFVATDAGCSSAAVRAADEKQITCLGAAFIIDFITRDRTAPTSVIAADYRIVPPRTKRRRTGKASAFLPDSGSLDGTSLETTSTESTIKEGGGRPKRKSAPQRKGKARKRRKAA